MFFWLFTPTKPIMRHYQYAMALKRDSVRQHFSDQTIVIWLNRLYHAKTKKEKNKLSKEIEWFIEKDKHIHAEMRKILD